MRYILNKLRQLAYNLSWFKQLKFSHKIQISLFRERQ